MRTSRLAHVFSLPLLCGVLLLALAACDSNGGDDDEGEDDLASGEATLSLSGEGIDESFDWNAAFAVGTDPDTGEEGIVIYLYPGQDIAGAAQYAFISRVGATRPSTGTYEFGDVDTDEDDAFMQKFGMLGMLQSSNQTFELFYSDAGSLTITSSSQDRLAGSFDIDGTFFTYSGGQQEPQEVDIDITGSFDAESTPTIVVPGNDF